MTRLNVSLLGFPRIEREGNPVPQPKGKKAWALLAYLLLSDGPRTRNHLAELLFGGADDPLGALRWNLSQLRRVLNMPQALRGHEPVLEVGPDVVVDVDVLTRGTWSEAARIRGLGCELLEGMAFPADPVFETWLTLERARLQSVSKSVLREASAACLGTRRPDMAADFASRALALDQLDESSHELLIRALAAAGLQEKATDALDRCVRIFREELHARPGEAVEAALKERPSSFAPSRGSAAARAQLELGRSAIKAGAVDAGIDGLRAALWAAEEEGDDRLVAEALFALAYALVHSVRGRDGEASALLHRALQLAERHGLHDVAADSLRELGYVEMLVGSYDRALASLDRSLRTAGGGREGRAWTLAYRAICYSDTGRYTKAHASLERCLEEAAGPEISHPRAYAFCLLGRVQMLRGELADARTSLERAIEIAAACGWTVFLPWPQALLAEVDLLAGAAAAEVTDRLEHALSVAEQIGDPCWEGAALHGLGLVAASSGRFDEAAARLETASSLCVRFPDSYLWMKAYILDALCDVATRNGSAETERWIGDLQNLAARTGMTEFLVRAHLYRARGGDEHAASLARLMSREVDNPALLSEL
jgi:DNA-binding SARP family transcriptional activator